MAHAEHSRRTLEMAASLALAMLLSACTTTEDSSDYEVTGKAEQVVPLTQAGVIVVRCHCPRREVVVGTSADRLEIHTVGAKSSYGYHGTQARPGSVPAAALQFHVDVRPGALILESREWTHIHHAMLLENVRVIAPAGREVRFEPIAMGDLEGRKVRDEGE
jgi:hypothetical protein